MGDRFKNKLEQLGRLKEILLANPQGLRKAELARRLDVHRSTVSEYLDDLGYQVPVYEPVPDHYAINRDMYQVEVLLTLDEALALHLASRLLALRTDKHYPHAAKALRALGTALEQIAPLVSTHLRLSAGVLDGDERRRDPIFLQALELLTRAWALGRKVRLTHEMEDGRIFEYTFAPYFLEPYAAGRTLHAIGWREPPGALRTFKVERIRTVQLLDERYEIPETFDPLHELKDAWGIWYTEEEPEEVVLRFSRAVAYRVRESRWQHGEEVRELPDGGLEWRAAVAAWQEMVPWIRGWGAECEVLAPEGLRREIAAAVRDAASLYADEAPDPPPIHLLPYAKTRPQDHKVHRLLYHLIDVGQVALALWEEALPPGPRRHLAGLLGVSEDAAGRFVAFLSALHDLGKASPAYQAKYAPHALLRQLRAAGLELDGYSLATRNAPHGVVSTWALPQLLQGSQGLEAFFSRCLARVVGGHHGAWPSLTATDGIRDDEAWESLRSDLYWEVQAVFRPPTVCPSEEMTDLNTFFTWLSGFISVADWIGSFEDYFEFEDGVVHSRRYAQRAAGQARKALQELGWLGWRPQGDTPSFQEVFSWIEQLRPVQEAFLDAASGIATPALLILEAPTGSGKTEAALYQADRWLQGGGGRGLYVAMPTQATSNQMFERVRDFLKQRFPADLVNLHLIHGQAQWSDTLAELSLHRVGEDDLGRVAAVSWFKPRKRTLLAPFAVGTVDQTLLSVLQTRHFFVRLFGLGHKVVVFDEVHAYDTFMSTIFQRLLAWLRQLGTPVIMLSATLPAATRRELVAAYAGLGATEEVEAYPCLTVATKDGVTVRPLPAPPDEVLHLDWSLSRDPAAIAAYLRDKLPEDGCAVVICNTVRRAQDVYLALKEASVVPDEDLILFHARFPPAWRQGIEAKVLNRFGKPGTGTGPRRGVVVATQVVEQSLDIDFDMMISELAPVDLLLQRAGRLHRHQRPERPPLPRRLTILQPQMTGDVPLFGPGDVYAPYLLLRTYLALRQRDTLAMPSETRALIEGVYGEPGEDDLAPGALTEALRDTRRDLEAARHAAWSKATLHLVCSPEDESLLFHTNAQLEEDDPETHSRLRAQTRDIDPGVSLICLHRHGDGLAVSPEGEGASIDLDQEPDPQLTQILLQHGLTVQSWPVVQHFLQAEVPPGWRRHGALRYYRVAVFVDGVCRLPGAPFALSLSRELGLAVHKEDV
jgi:CRISPR-associated endonuclease/helicase Cas3